MVSGWIPDASMRLYTPVARQLPGVCGLVVTVILFVLVTEPIDNNDDCAREWSEAYQTCRELLEKPNPPKGITGGYKNLNDCARGLVSEACGGNPLS